MLLHDSALVVKKKSASTLLLIVKKRWVLGNFFSGDVPPVGAVIAIEWRNARAYDTIDISGWNHHIEPMGGFIVNESDGVIKFTGMFYTTGCVIRCGVPLDSPAVFNNLIGVVDDEAKVLKEDYIGKLKATVTLDEEPNGYHWTLCTVDEYFKKGNNEVFDPQLPYRGVVGAVKQGPTKAVNYITSRYFPKDVRFFSKTNVSPQLIDSLLGREVYFVAVKGSRKDDSPSVVGQISAITANNLNSSQYGVFFKVEVEVEYIGCTDEYGNTIVWSDQLEFMVDIHALFKGLAYGVYRIQAVRHHKTFEFTRWKITKVVHLIEDLSGDSVRAARPSRTSRSSSNRSGRQREGNDSRIRDRSTGKGSYAKTGASAKIRNNLHDSGVTDLLEERSGSGGCASPSCYREEKPTPKEDLENTLRIYLHRCLESVKVRASIKQADPVFFDALVAALMRV